MVSNFPSVPMSPDQPPLRPEQMPEQPTGLGGRVFDRLHEAFCGLHGHDNLLQFQQDRMFLKCVSCGHESPGWELNEAPPRALGRTDNRCQAVVRPQLIRARRIA